MSGVGGKLRDAGEGLRLWVLSWGGYHYPYSTTYLRDKMRKASRAFLFGAITLASLGYVLVWALPR